MGEERVGSRSAKVLEMGEGIVELAKTKQVTINRDII